MNVELILSFVFLLALKITSKVTSAYKNEQSNRNHSTWIFMISLQIEDAKDVPTQHNMVGFTAECVHWLPEKLRN